MQRRQQCHLRPFLVRGAAADHHPPQARPIDDAAFEWGRAPLCRVILLDVVHEVDGERRRRAVIERGEHAGLALSRNHLDFRKPRLARQLRHVLRPLRVAQVLGGNGGQRDPLAEEPNRLVVLRLDLRKHGVAVAALSGERNGSAKREAGGGGSGCGDEVAARGVLSVTVAHLALPSWPHLSAKRSSRSLMQSLTLRVRPLYELP
jgi:hypothetical protein